MTDFYWDEEKKFFFEKKIPNLVLQKDFAWVVQIEREWAQNDRKKKADKITSSQRISAIRWR